MSTAINNVGGAARGKGHRSYGQLEAESTASGRNMLLEGDLLSVYSRLCRYRENGAMMPVKIDVRHRSTLETAARSDLFPRRRTTAVAAEQGKMAHPIPCCAPAPIFF